MHLTRGVVLRLLAATLIGAVVGRDRNLHGKPTGVRMMGPVALIVGGPVEKAIRRRRPHRPEVPEPLP